VDEFIKFNEILDGWRRKTGKMLFVFHGVIVNEGKGI
jgi:hypothetical protein